MAKPPYSRVKGFYVPRPQNTRAKGRTLISHVFPFRSDLYKDLEEQRREAEAAAHAVQERVDALKAVQHDASATVQEVHPPPLLSVLGIVVYGLGNYKPEYRAGHQTGARVPCIASGRHRV